MAEARDVLPIIESSIKMKQVRCDNILELSDGSLQINYTEADGILPLTHQGAGVNLSRQALVDAMEQVEELLAANNTLLFLILAKQAKIDATLGATFRANARGRIAILDTSGAGNALIL